MSDWEFVEEVSVEDLVTGDVFFPLDTDGHVGHPFGMLISKRKTTPRTACSASRRRDVSLLVVGHQHLLREYHGWFPEERVLRLKRET